MLFARDNELNSIIKRRPVHANGKICAWEINILPFQKSNLNLGLIKESMVLLRRKTRETAGSFPHHVFIRGYLCDPDHDRRWDHEDILPDRVWEHMQRETSLCRRVVRGVHLLSHSPGPTSQPELYSWSFPGRGNHRHQLLQFDMDRVYYPR